MFAEEETEAVPERAIAVGATESSVVAEAALSKAATRAGRRRRAAQSSLFDLANQKVVDELRAAKVEAMNGDDAKALLSEMKKKLM